MKNSSSHNSVISSYRYHLHPSSDTAYTKEILSKEKWPHPNT